MFCSRCGANLVEGAQFCTTCGTPVAVAPATPVPPVTPVVPVAPVAPVAPPVPPVAPAAPVYPTAPTAPLDTAPTAPVYTAPTAPVYTAPPVYPGAPVAATAPANDFAATLRKITHIIVAGIGILAFIMAVINLFGLYNVRITSGRFSVRADVSDLFEASAAILIGNLLYGLIGLGISAIAALYHLKHTIHLDIYDKLIGKLVQPLVSKFVEGDGILTLLGAIGSVVILHQLIFYLCAGEGGTVYMHFTSWIMFFLYTGIAAAEIFWLNKKQK